MDRRGVVLGPCFKCGRRNSEDIDRKALRDMAGQLSESSLCKAVPPRTPVCSNCARDAIIDRIVREVHWCDKRGIRWGRKKVA